MRIIEFRGKRVDNSEWVYGSLIVDSEFSCRIVTNKNQPYEWVDVFPDTVGQFLGFKDKNKVRVFEGDKVKSPKHPNFPYTREGHIIVYKGAPYFSPIDSTVGSYLSDYFLLSNFEII